MSVYDFAKSYKFLLKGEQFAIDNEVFRMHYRGSVLLLIVFSAVLSAKQFFGDPITCHIKEGSLQGLVTTYCWVHGTYTLKNKDWVVEDNRDFTQKEQTYMQTYGFKQNMLGAAHPGYGTFQAHRHDKVYHYYYQWVCLVFFLQAGMFYLPRYFWKKFEGGRMMFCTKGMADPQTDEKEMKNRVGTLVDNYKRFKNKNNRYATKFLFFEVTNLMNAAAQMFLMDKFMGGRFFDYGLRLLAYFNFDGDQTLLVDPMDEVFPKMTKCDFHYHSSAGQINLSDAMCLLPQNIVNEKVFLVMWFWFIFLITATSFAVLYRTVLIFVPDARTCMIWKEGSKWEHVASATRHGQFGDWFLLRQMSKNVDAAVFAEFLKQLDKEENIWSEKGTLGRRSSMWPDRFLSLRKRISSSGTERLSEEHSRGSEATSAGYTNQALNLKEAEEGKY